MSITFSAIRFNEVPPKAAGLKLSRTQLPPCPQPPLPTWTVAAKCAPIVAMSSNGTRLTKRPLPENRGSSPWYYATA
jgi:hypothetical protein